MSTEEFSSNDERRRWSRFRKDRGWDNAVVHCADGAALPAEVNDESLCGISLFLTEIHTLEVGQIVDVDYEGERRQSRICHIEEEDCGGFVLGFDCSLIAAVEPTSAHP